MILMASVFFIVSEKSNSIIIENKKVISAGYWLTQASLLVFWVTLIISGAKKSYLSYSFPEMSFQEIMTSVRSYLSGFAISGVFLAIGILVVVFPLLKNWRRWTAA
jgi:nitric oxide reductase subunit B